MPKGIYERTEENKQNIREATKKAMNRPEVKLKISTAMRGENHPRYGLRGEAVPGWKGGCTRYWHREARRIWEEYWRQPVPLGYCIHHVDKDYTNNDVCNLALLTWSYHAVIHGCGGDRRSQAYLRRKEACQK